MGRSLLTVQGYVELMIDDEFIASRCARLDEAPACKIGWSERQATACHLPLFPCF